MTTNPGWKLEDLELSPAGKEYLDSLPVSGGPSEVLGRWFSRGRDDALAEKHWNDRQQAAADARLDFVEQARFEGRELRDFTAVLRDFEVASAIVDAQEESRRRADAERRAAAAEERAAELGKRFAPEIKQRAVHAAVSQARAEMRIRRGDR